MSQTKTRTAITPTRKEDFPEWYQQVVRAAELAENSPVRGCMIIKPWGYGVWEQIQQQLDKMIKDTGHENAYFPLFIPLSFLEREAAHVEGFAKECAVVTHHRLEADGGKLKPAGPLEEPLVVRPTSETIIGDAFSRWVQSHRDLPLLINQWANVVRWEMRTRLFLRTTEFLWQEGHTVHATAEEAKEETMQMLEVYRDFVENVLAIPLIVGEKSESERFPGAEHTYCIEAMMQDGKALQGGTSHYLGQNFAKAFDIQFNNIDEELEHAYSTSWGVTTRLIGAMVMTHGDDDGMRLPPRVAAKQAIILPIYRNDEERETVMAAAASVKKDLAGTNFYGRPIEAHIDDRDLRGGEKKWGWVKKGAPLLIEIGPRDVAKGAVMVARRDTGEKQSLEMEALGSKIPVILDEMQSNLFKEALAMRESRTRRDITDFEGFKAYFQGENPGFVIAKWCEEVESEELLTDLKVTVRCLPLEQSGTTGKCVLTGKDATRDAVFARAY